MLFYLPVFGLIRNSERLDQLSFLIKADLVSASSGETLQDSTEPLFEFSLKALYERLQKHSVLL